MAGLTYQAQKNLQNIILSCVPRDGEGKTWTEIWKAAKHKGIGSKETFSAKFKMLNDRGYVKHRGRLFTRDKGYEFDPKIQSELDSALRSPRHIKPIESTSSLFQMIQVSYERLLAELVAETNDHKAALEKIDLYLRIQLNPQLQAYAENFWKIRDRGHIKRVAEQILASQGHNYRNSP